MLKRIQGKRRFIIFRDIEKIEQFGQNAAELFLKNGKKIRIVVDSYENFNKIRITSKNFSSSDGLII